MLNLLPQPLETLGPLCFNLAYQRKLDQALKPLRDAWGNHADEVLAATPHGVARLRKVGLAKGNPLLFLHWDGVWREIGLDLPQRPRRGVEIPPPSDLSLGASRKKSQSSLKLLNTQLNRLDIAPESNQGVTRILTDFQTLRVNASAPTPFSKQ